MGRPLVKLPLFGTHLVKLALIGGMFSSCAAPVSSPAYEVVSEKPAYEYELVTIEQQALEEIAGSPTQFQVDSIEDRHAWARALIFFEKHAASFNQQAEQKTDSAKGKLRINGLSINNNYAYQVTRKLNSSGQYSYQVECQPASPGAQRDLAVRNAKNLSRFIADGKLEASLITN